jgi:peptide methionine sulfoxide reductase msrA/msrB
VNSVSIDFVPAEEANDRNGRAIFASGCFWGTEYWMQRAPGVLATRVGYTGGTLENPTYRDVCGGGTGHAEAVEVIFDPAVTDYAALVRLFFETHDPSQVDRQGPDVGSQYRSEIFFIGEDQKKIAEAIIGELRDMGHAVVTRLTPAGPFWEAELYHQDYYQKKNGTPYCHTYVRKFASSRRGETP